MSKFRRQSKPILDISSNVQFPTLSFGKAHAPEKPVWNCEKVSQFSDNAKHFDNGDIYEGDFDEIGLPCYGKMTFSNGNIYEGPIREYWIKDDEEKEEEDEEEKTEDDDEKKTEVSFTEDEYSDDDYEYYDEQEPEQTYGKMTYSNGKVFWGVFCFTQRNKWT